MAEVDYLPQIITGAAGLIGSIIGSASTILAQVIFRRVDHKDRTRSLAFGLAAELASYIELMERRGHVRNAEAIIHRLRLGENVSIMNFGDTAERRQEYFPIFKSQAPSIGLLGAEKCKLLASFHRGIDAVLMTAESAQRGEYEHMSPSQKADLVEGELEIWRGAMNVGKALVPKLYEL